MSTFARPDSPFVSLNSGGVDSLTLALIALVRRRFARLIA